MQHLRRINRAQILSVNGEYNVHNTVVMHKYGCLNFSRDVRINTSKTFFRILAEKKYFVTLQTLKNVNSKSYRIAFISRYLKA